MLVLHESFGLNDDMRRIAARFAEEGYAVLLPNLFSHGTRIVCLSRVMTDMVRGSIDREIADILAARAALPSARTSTPTGSPSPASVSAAASP